MKKGVARYMGVGNNSAAADMRTDNMTEVKNKRIYLEVVMKTDVDIEMKEMWQYFGNRRLNGHMHATVSYSVRSDETDGLAHEGEGVLDKQVKKEEEEGIEYQLL